MEIMELTSRGMGFLRLGVVAVGLCGVSGQSCLSLLQSLNRHLGSTSSYDTQAKSLGGQSQEDCCTICLCAVITIFVCT